MADPKLTPALPRAQVKTPQLEKPAAKPAASRPEVGAPGLTAKQKSRIGGADYMTRTQAPHVPTKTPSPPPPSKELLALDEMGRMLLATTTQVNSVSYALNNKNDICGGAAVVGALLLTSTTPAATRANAAVLRTAFNASPAKGRTSVDLQMHVSAALKNFEAGKLSEEDVCYLQQAAYVVGKGVPGESEKGGLATGSMAAMVADLVGAGATLGPETSFAQAWDGAGGHWVGRTGELNINSAEAGPGAAQVELPKLTVDNPQFSGRVRILNDKAGAPVVQMQSRYRAAPPVTSPRTPPTKPDGSGWQAQVSARSPLQAGLQGSNASELLKSLHAIRLFTPKAKPQATPH